MGIALMLSELYVPEFIKKPMLLRLFQVTAEAFRVNPPLLNNLSYKECLRTYAEFTQDQAQKLIDQGNIQAESSRLFENASRLGLEFRERFHVRKIQEVMRAGRILYRQIGIDFHGEHSGDIVVRSCYFSAYYSVGICQMISSLDAGLLSGLSNGGQLRFSSRITGGASCCQAYLDFAGN